MSAVPTAKEIELLLVCIKHSCKPDMKAVSEELGCTDKQAYHRHWALMRKLTGGTAIAAPKTPGAKRGRPAMTAAKGKGKGKGHDAVADVEDDDEVEDKKPFKKVKKEAKRNGDEKAVKVKREVVDVDVDKDVVDVDVDDDDDDAETIAGEDEN